MDRWVEGQVVEHKTWGPGLFSLFVKPLSPIPFTAGQFTQLGLTEKPSRCFRPYSFVNPPDVPVLEFYYDLIETGSFSPQLAALTSGDKVWVGRKGAGFFTLSELQEAKHLWLFATGTGLGPFLSILKTDEPWRRFNKVILIHSVRYQAGLSHQDELKGLKAKYLTQFEFAPIVTRERGPDFFHERIPHLLDNHELEDKLGLSLKKGSAQIMLCGNPLMLEQVTQRLVDRGMTLNRLRQPGEITVESYWKA